MDLESLLALVAAIADQDADALADLDANLIRAAEDIASGDDLTDEDLTNLERISEAITTVRTEAAARDEAAAERAGRAEAALLAIRGEAPDEGDDGEPASDDEAETDDATESDDTTEADEAETDELVQIAAGAAPTPPVVLSRVAARRPAPGRVATMPAEPGDLRSLSLVASANAPGVPAGQPITDYDQLAAAFVSAVQTAQDYRGPAAKVSIARAATTYPETHVLGDSWAANHQRIEAAQRAIQRAGGVRQGIANGLTASGGICAPKEVNYDMPVLGSDARPVRDQWLTRFQADRGGITTMPSPVLTQLDAAVGVHTEANDVSGLTKACLTVTCPTETSTVVEAMYRCLQFGNFRSRFFPEQIEAWMRLAVTEHAREAEVRLLAKIATGSTAVTHGQVLGTSRDVLSAIDRAVAQWRYRHRTEDGFVLQFAAPRWLRDQIRVDVARQIPVGTVDETMALADSTIDGWFRARNVEPTWLMDGESGQTFGTQGVGPMIGWPSTVKTYLAPAGGWLFLDGGTLDLGIVRDSVLNGTNDVRMFAETFEGAHFHGVESWTLTIDVCPDGSTSSTIDINPCASGS